MLQPLGSRVLVAPKKAEEKTKSGILVPTQKNEIQQTGTIIAVGDGHTALDGSKIPLTVKCGDEVVFAKYAGTKILDGGKEFLLMEERDIMARIIPSKP